MVLDIQENATKKPDYLLEIKIVAISHLYSFSFSISSVSTTVSINSFYLLSELHKYSFYGMK